MLPVVGSPHCKPSLSLTSQLKVASLEPPICSDEIFWVLPEPLLVSSGVLSKGTLWDCHTCSVSFFHSLIIHQDFIDAE